MTQSLYDYCSSCGMTALLEQWDTEKNAPLTPQTVRCGSRQKVWWRCDRGHRWQALVKSRTGGSGCPVCRNRLLLPGENDLATRFPALAAQWHPTRNGALTPAQVLCTSHHRAWWRCAYGHAWQSRVSSRTQSGTDCPVCAGRAVQTGFNDLAHCFPSLAAQWDRQKNGALSPEQVTAYSNRPVWWRCKRGHSYRAAVGARTNAGSGCPYCAGRKVLAGFNDLMTVEPQVASQWHPTLNGALTPQMVTAGSRKKVWWQCGAGHAWKAVVFSRTGPKRCGCPVCAGRAREPHSGPDADASV